MLDARCLMADAGCQMPDVARRSDRFMVCRLGVRQSMVGSRLPANQTAGQIEKNSEKANIEYRKMNVEC